jgi:hypothetical protein
MLRIEQLNKKLNSLFSNNLRGRVKFPIGGMASAGRARDPDGGPQGPPHPVDLV